LIHNLIRKRTENLKLKPIMKKIIYIILLAVSSAMVITSCTEEEVIVPQAEGTVGGNADTGKI
jgi:hypothetical protein